MAVLRALPRDPGFVRLEGTRVRRGRLCLVLEWVPGRTLKQLLREQGPLPVDTAVEVTRSLLRSLHRLHRAGFVHGDLHVGNVLVADGPRGSVKLIDFQHAVRKGPGGRAPGVRRLGRPPAHLPPETSTGILDDRFDLYGVGFMGAAMLLGRAPRAGEIARLAATAPGAAADMPLAPAGGSEQERHRVRALWQVFARATDPDPAARYPSARAMLAALRRAAAIAP